MKRLLPLFLALLLLTGCAAPAEQQADPQGGPSAAEPQTSPDVSIEPPLPSQPDPQPQPDTAPITKASLRAEYEAQGLTVREIVPYEGDFLVYCGNDPSGGIFQWVYADTGLRAPLLYCDQKVLNYEIQSIGSIRVLAGGPNLYNGSLSFPRQRYAIAQLPVSSEGTYMTDFYSSGFVSAETYWAPLSDSHTFGWDHGKVALVDVRIGANCVEAVFGPTVDNLTGFFAAASSRPVTTPVYDEAAHTLTLRFRSTVLASGQRTEFADETARKHYEDYASHCQLPTSFPAGTIKGSNDFIRSAEVRTDGEDTLLILTLTELAAQYTVDGGQLLRNESRPYLRLSLRDERDY